jgi:class 3 adenylate cyclase
LAVVEDGRPVRLDRRRMRALLAFLLLNANQLVSSDRLIDEVWGPEPPKTAGASLQNYISRLRKAIGAEHVISQAPGYVLRVDPERFDLARFERLTAEARGADARERSEKLRAALALWRGPALEDLAFEPFARDEVGRLEEARLAALEERIAADLELGRDGDLVGELEQLVEEHPLRERFRAQLMHALYRAGRQADALAAFQAARQVLLDELGLEPSQELRDLQQAILRQDPSLGPRADEDVRHGADRRTVSVLFCDLVGSSELAAQLDPEAYRALLSRYFEAVRGPIERHGGTVEKFIGDAVLAVFGVPELHEDDALRAVRAAVEARDALQEQEIAARIGVSTGEVHVLSAPGEDLHVSGAAASIASRLESRAPTGGVLLSDKTYALVRDALRAQAFDGAWLVDALVPGAPAYARRLDAQLVGRAEELARLQGAYADARDNKHARVVTVVGEAGIGKTRLLRELVESVGDEARVLVGRCVSYGEGATYLPIAEIVRQASREVSLAGIEALLEAEDDGEQVAKRVAELVGVGEGPAAPGEAFWAVRRFVESLARRQPLVLVLDDIHWAEPTLLDLIEYLGEWVEAPVVILCAARGELIDDRPGWGGPTSTGFLIQLKPLDSSDVATLVERLAGEPVPPNVEQRIVEQSGGNPLYAEQLVAHAREAPDVSLGDAPPTVEALIASRLDRLDPRELGVLRRAAVIGRLFSREELDDVTPADELERVERHLVELTHRALVHPGPDHFRFHHVLVRDVAYRSIPKSERVSLHELAARALDRRDGADELVGYHFEQAYHHLIELAAANERSQELAAAGGERLGRAGIRAWKRADAPAAVNLLSRARELREDADVTCELALALNVTGQRGRAEEILADLPVLRAGLERAYLQSLEEPGRAGDLLKTAEDAIPIFEQAGDDRGLGRAWYCVAHVRGGFYCEYSAMEHAADQIGACYTRAGWSTGAAADLLGLALSFGPRPVGDAVAILEAFKGVDSGDRTADANAAVWLGWLEAMRGNFDVARDHVGRARSTYRDLGLTTADVDHCGRAVGAIELVAGRLDAAEEALRDACALLQELDQSAVLATRGAELANVLYEREQYDEAWLWIERARESASDEDVDARLAREPVEARVLAKLGRVEEAGQLARSTLSLVAGTDALNRHAETRLALAGVLYLAGSDQEARENTEQALALYEQKGNTAAAARVRTRLQTLTATR